MPTSRKKGEGLKNETPPPSRSKHLSKNLWNWVIIGLYAAGVLAIVPLHEPWKDEAHTWLIARDLSYHDIIRQMHYEGYPLLWFFLQAPLAKAGLPFVSLGLLNAFCATLAVAVLVFFSPFSLWQKAMIAFSDCLFCLCGMIWRCYSLLILALFLVVASYPLRHRRPLIYAGCVALLANIHVLSLGVALLFFLGFLIETIQLRKQARSGIAPTNVRIGMSAEVMASLIMAAGIILAILPLRQAPDCRGPGLFPLFHPEAPFEFLAGAFYRFQLWHGFDLPGFTMYPLTVLAFLFLLWDLWPTRGAFWLLVLTFLGWSYVFMFKNSGPGLQHCPLLFLMMVVACWLARAANSSVSGVHVDLQRGKFAWRGMLPVREVIIFASLAYGLLYVPFWVYCEVRYPFSAGKDAAACLRDLSLDEPVVAFPLATGQSLLPYLPGRKFWSMEMGRFDTFDTPCQKYDAFDVKAPKVAPILGSRRPWLVIGNGHPTDPDFLRDYELVFPSTPEYVWFPAREQFWVYQPRDRSDGVTTEEPHPTNAAGKEQ